jgi:hypothetical protein
MPEFVVPHNRGIQHNPSNPKGAPISRQGSWHQGWCPVVEVSTWR